MFSTLPGESILDIEVDFFCFFPAGKLCQMWRTWDHGASFNVSPVNSGPSDEQSQLIFLYMEQIAYLYTKGR